MGKVFLDMHVVVRRTTIRAIGQFQRDVAQVSACRNCKAKFPFPLSGMKGFALDVLGRVCWAVRPVEQNSSHLIM